MVSKHVNILNAKFKSEITSVNVVLCVSFPYISVTNVENRNYFLGAQDVSKYGYGSYTGEVSAEMLSDMGCKYVIIGHSERRLLFGETYHDISMKATLAVSHGITPIVCIGDIDESKKESQLREMCNHLPSDLVKNNELVIAYEPVYAIGTGNVLNSAEIEHACNIIRSTLANSKQRVLYGGSVSSKNIDSILETQGLNGVLVGGASIEVDEFYGICSAVNSLCHNLHQEG
ncbi:MAG: triose-phosphate isomerase [Candidatus Xenolissoclinum pacificiensis L6]|uniref:Triosephosphate isomerase n=1 Tax=Candidatus Xenolissoclinum pacificiensis L6 TaxID=1401685 RepID=W2UZQ6_9RICK|nr:MAG: triose-phosphate isomerase [Candidatus Xenolissoclinum pacificiensis L6]